MTSSVVNSRSRRLACVASLAVCLLCSRNSAVQAQPGAGPSPVTVAEALKRKVRSEQTFVGTVVPLRKAVIGSAVDGRVDQFLINEGDRVRKNDHLAQLLTETITSELKTAVRDWQLRIAELQELDPKQNIDIDEELLKLLVGEKLVSEKQYSTKESSSSGAGADEEKLMGKLDKEIEEAEALRESAEASQVTADSEYQRVARLKGQNITTQQELDNARLSLIQANAVLKERDAAERYARSTREFRINQAIERIRMQEAIVEKLFDQKRKHTIITRFDGYITAEFTEEGAWVNRGDPIAEVAALDEVDVSVSVLDEQSPYVYTGEEVTVEIPALPEEDRKHPGVVVVVNPQADPRTRTVPVKIRVKNRLQKKPAGTEPASGEEQTAPDNESGTAHEVSTPVAAEEDEDTYADSPVPLIKAGMLANVTLSTGPWIDSWFVPLDAITLLGKGRPPVIYVFLPKAGASAKDPTGSVIPVAVKVGKPWGSLIAVEVIPQGDATFEFKPGSRVIVRGNERLRPGQAVKITEELNSKSMAGDQPESNSDSATDAETPKGDAKTK